MFGIAVLMVAGGIWSLDASFTARGYYSMVRRTRFIRFFFHALFALRVIGGASSDVWTVAGITE